MASQMPQQVSTGSSRPSLWSQMTSTPQQSYANPTGSITGSMVFGSPTQQVAQPPTVQPQVSGDVRQQGMPQTSLTQQQNTAFNLGFGPVSQNYANTLALNNYQKPQQPTLPSGQVTFADLVNRLPGQYF